MNRMEGLRAGAAEMRSVAQKLMEWARDLERSAAENSREVQPDETGGLPGGEASAAALTLPEVRKILAEKCAAGFGTQVKALIESYGASTLKEVPAELRSRVPFSLRSLPGAP